MASDGGEQPVVRISQCLVWYEIGDEGWVMESRSKGDSSDG